MITKRNIKNNLNKKITKYLYNKFTKKRKYKHNKKGRGSQNTHIILSDYELAKIKTDNIIKQAGDVIKELQKNLKKHRTSVEKRKYRRKSRRLLQRDNLPPNYKE